MCIAFVDFVVRFLAKFHRCTEQPNANSVHYAGTDIPTAQAGSDTDAHTVTRCRWTRRQSRPLRRTAAYSSHNNINESCYRRANCQPQHSHTHRRRSQQSDPVPQNIEQNAYAPPKQCHANDDANNNTVTN